VIQVLDGWDDEQLLAALREAVKARRAVPSWFVETGKSAYAWHNIDAELAQLTYDSRTDADAMTAARSETATIRALTFTSAHLSIELEVADGSLFGQVVPPQAGALETHTKEDVTTSPVDEAGFFTLEPIPPGPFLLRFRTTGGAYVMTGWITLLLRPRPRRYALRPGNPRLASPGHAQPPPVRTAASARTPNATEYEVAVAMAPTTNAPSPVPASKLRFHAMLTESRAGSPAAANA
jgi:hypothetical protein